MAVAVICGTAGAAAPAKVHVGLSASFALSGGGALWVTDRVGNKLIRVDPAAGRVKWRLGIPSSPFGLTYGAGSVWVGSRNTTRVTRVNPTTKKVRARISVGAAPYALAFGAGSVWVSNESSRNRQPHRAEAQPGREDDSRRRRPEWHRRRLRQGLGRRLRAQPPDPHRPRSQPGREAHLAAQGRLDLVVGRRALGLERDREHLKVDPASMAVVATVKVGREPARDHLGRRQPLGAEHRRQHASR